MKNGLSRGVTVRREHRLSAVSAIVVMGRLRRPIVAVLAAALAVGPTAWGAGPGADAPPAAAEAEGTAAATRPPADPATVERARRLAADLSSPDWAAREAAQSALVGIGPPALEVLGEVAAGDDTEAAWRSRIVLEQIAAAHDDDVLMQVVSIFQGLPGIEALDAVDDDSAVGRLMTRIVVAKRSRAIAKLRELGANVAVMDLPEGSLPMTLAYAGAGAAYPVIAEETLAVPLGGGFYSGSGPIFVPAASEPLVELTPAEGPTPIAPGLEGPTPATPVPTEPTPAEFIPAEVVPASPAARPTPAEADAPEAPDAVAPADAALDVATGLARLTEAKDLPTLAPPPDAAAPTFGGGSVVVAPGGRMFFRGAGGGLTITGGAVITTSDGFVLGGGGPGGGLSVAGQADVGLGPGWRGTAGDLALLRDLGATVLVSFQGRTVTAAEFEVLATLPLQMVTFVQSQYDLPAAIKFRERRSDVALSINSTALLGVSGDTDGDGWRISTVGRGSGADEAGLRVGDVVTSIDTTPIKTFQDLQLTIGGYRPGDTVAVHFTRGPRDRQVQATLKPRAEVEGTMVPRVEAAPAPAFYGEPRLESLPAEESSPRPETAPEVIGPVLEPAGPYSPVPDALAPAAPEPDPAK